MVLIFTFSQCSFIIGFSKVENYVGISISTSEKIKQLGTPDEKFLLIVVNVFEKSYVAFFSLAAKHSPPSWKEQRKQDTWGVLDTWKIPTLIMLLLS